MTALQAKTGFTAAIMACALLMFSIEACDAQENVVARNSGAYIYGRIAGNLAVLGQCAEFDKENAIPYVDATDAYFQEVKPTLDLVQTILREEGVRSGKGPGHFISALPGPTMTPTPRR
jgi:hypothetical protein